MYKEFVNHSNGIYLLDSLKGLKSYILSIHADSFLEYILKKIFRIFKKIFTF